MNNYWAFGTMRAANDLLGDRAALHARLDEDGYLYIRQVLDVATVSRVRNDMLQVLAARGWVPPSNGSSARAVGLPVREGEEAFFATYDDIQRLESFHALAHDDALLGLMRRVLDDTAFPHPLKVARLVFPANPEISTPPHQDYPNNQGTPSLTAVWIPLGDCPRHRGSLAILAGSHRFGVLPLAFALGPGNRQAIIPEEVRSQTTWVTADLAAGDVVVFPALTVHAALHNAGFDMRLSADFRYQREGEDLTAPVLQPHFGRLSWDDVYAAWEDSDLKYYWRRLRYNVVPFDHDLLRATAATPADLKEVADYEMRRALRHLHRRGEGPAPAG